MPGPAVGLFGILVARLFSHAWTKIAPAVTAASSRRGLILQAGTAALTALTIDELRQEAVKIAPGSDPEALEEAARQVMRMVGADGSDVQFPTNGPPNYFMMNMQNGQMWFTTRYNSSKTVAAARKRGAARGFASGKRDMARTAIVGKG